MRQYEPSSMLNAVNGKGSRRALTRTVDSTPACIYVMNHHCRHLYKRWPAFAKTRDVFMVAFQ